MQSISLPFPIATPKISVAPELIAETFCVFDFEVSSPDTSLGVDFLDECFHSLAGADYQAQ